jgi:hypothetical protein
MRKTRQPDLNVVRIKTVEDSQHEVQSSVPVSQDEVHEGLIVKAQNLPNLDNRPSILGDDLPQGLVVEGRKSFAIPDAQKELGTRVANPRLGEWVQSRPGAEWGVTMYGMKDGNTGIVHPVLESLVSTIPQLAFHAKLWDWRMAVTTKKQPYLWPTPIGGLRLTPSDHALHEAKEKSYTEWVTIWFDGVMWQYRVAELGEGDAEVPKPQYPKGAFSPYLAKAIKRLAITAPSHTVIRGLIRPT